MQPEDKEHHQILYLTYDGLTDPLGQSQILPYLCGLSDMGYLITIISFEKQDKLDENKPGVINLCKTHHLDWVSLRYHKHPAVISTLYDLFQLRRVTHKLQSEKHFTIVHCRSYITSITGLWLKRKYLLKFIFDMRGFWADERVEGRVWNIKNIFYKIIFNFFKRKEKQFIIGADQIITLTENAKKEILSWEFDQISPMDLSAKISVIPTCVDTDLFNRANINRHDQQKLRRFFGINENDFVLLYLGSLGTWYVLEEMLNFFTCLKKEISDARFIFLTNDVNWLNKKLVSLNYKQDIDRQLELWDKNNSSPEGSLFNSAIISPISCFDNSKIMITHCQRSQIPLYISLSTASIFFIKPSYSKKGSSATKLGESIAMSIPVITNKGWGDIDKLVGPETGYSVQSFSIEEYRRVVKEINDHIHSSQHNVQKNVMESFSLQYGVYQIDNIYKKLI